MDQIELGKYSPCPQTPLDVSSHYHPSILELHLNYKIITQIILHRIVLMQSGHLDK